MNFAGLMAASLVGAAVLMVVLAFERLLSRPNRPNQPAPGAGAATPQIAAHRR